jgi:cell wall-associated NlpC family hydrolase
MSYADVLSRIQQLQQLVDPSTGTSSGTSTSADGQDFQTMFASVTGGTATTADTSNTGTATGAYGTTVTGSAVTGSTVASAPVAGASVAGASVAGAPVAGASVAGASSTATSASTGMTAQTATAGAVTTGTPVSGNDVVANSIQYLGVPYRWGGTDPSNGLDCSGLVQKVYANEGVALPRTSAEQATTGTEVAGGLTNAQPGDLVFFGSPVHHVGIYAGNNMMIEAPHTGTKVQVHSIDATPTHVRRITMPSVTATPATTGLLGSQAVPAIASSSSALPATTVPAATQLAALSAVDPNTAMDALGVPASLRSIFTSAAQSQNLPVSLLAAVAKVESGFNLTSVSGAGAQGLMQLMPDTAAGIGANPWDATSAVNGAAKLLRGYVDKYSSVPLALAAYNAGTGAVAKYGGIPPYAETQAYVSRVQSLAAAA